MKKMFFLIAIVGLTLWIAACNVSSPVQEARGESSKISSLFYRFDNNCYASKSGIELNLKDEIEESNNENPVRYHIFCGANADSVYYKIGCTVTSHFIDTRKFEIGTQYKYLIIKGVEGYNPSAASYTMAIIYGEENVGLRIKDEFDDIDEYIILNRLEPITGSK